MEDLMFHNSLFLIHSFSHLDVWLFMYTGSVIFDYYCRDIELSYIASQSLFVICCLMSVVVSTHATRLREMMIGSSDI